MRLRLLQAAGFLTLVLLAITVWVLWPYHLLQSSATAINELYVQYRPFHYRWQGVRFASPGDHQESACVAIPEAKINKPRLWIAEAEKRMGPSERSLQLSGRINLLLCQIPAAISNY